MFPGNHNEKMPYMYKFRLSVLVPVYNVEPYLERCVRSIENQDIDKEDYEVLLINDGSTDDSLAIANKLAEEFSNILVYSKPNEGLSATRNYGIDHANGKYIMHVDSDDYLVENTIGKVLEVAENEQLDLCFFDAKSSKGNYLGRQSFDLYKVYTGEFVLLHRMKVGAVWKNIYSHDFLKRVNIRFYGNISHQDVEYNYRLYSFVEKLMFTDVCVYVYNVENDSITRTRDIQKMEKKEFDNLMVISNLIQFSQTAEISNELKSFLKKQMNSILVSILYSFLNKNSVYSLSFCKRFVKEAKMLSVYPIVGETNSKRTTRIIKWINCQPLYNVLLCLTKLKKGYNS